MAACPGPFGSPGKRPPSQRAREDAVFTERIRRIHLRSRGTYGAPRIHAELSDEGVRVARLMKAAGLQGVSRRKRVRTTIRQAGVRPAPDLAKRDFAVDGPNKLWMADTLAPALQVQVSQRWFLVFLSSRNNPGPCLI